MDDTKKLIEKYKRELMELSKTAPRSAADTDNSPEPQKSQKTPRIIGYVTEESSEFPAVFDRFITEAVENNEIETIQSAPPPETDNARSSLEDFPEDFSGEGDDPDATPDDIQKPDLASPFEPPAGNSLNLPAPEASTATSNSTPDDMSQGSGKPISDFPVPVYSTLEEFQSGNRGAGMLEFRVFTAREAMPVADAYIVVSTRINGRDHEIFNARTDNSGETGMKVLPAPSKELSQQSDNAIQPFSLYDATVEKEGYVKIILRDIPIFDGVQSIQRVAMIPQLLSENTTEEITEVNNAK